MKHLGSWKQSAPLTRAHRCAAAAAPLRSATEPTKPPNLDQDSERSRAALGIFESPRVPRSTRRVSTFHAPTHIAPPTPPPTRHPSGASHFGAPHSPLKPLSAFSAQAAWMAARSHLAEPHPLRTPSNALGATDPIDRCLFLSCGRLFLCYPFKIVGMKSAQMGRRLLTPPKVNNKSVSSPPAQSARVLQMGSVEETALKTLQEIAEQGLGRWGHYALGVDLLLSGGLRVTELVACPMVLVNANGQVLFKGRKGSADRLITPLYQRGYWLGLRGWVANPCAIVSRFAWYRFLKARGVVLHEKGHRHCSVTHAPRKLLAHQLFIEGVGSRSVADVVGHRSAKSAEWYRPQ